eukprot:TRINITY_DN7706_c0_g4_i1.p1 TRINITY_DN7706_c0_g4~~TRINITY_DN7706_c0_g4_i1.p1  ORF type:complete len:513 (+),score=105.77 TRINITY_DN7706_c0_g4_i1:268-1806(+)
MAKTTIHPRDATTTTNPNSHPHPHSNHYYPRRRPVPITKPRNSNARYHPYDAHSNNNHNNNTHPLHHPPRSQYKHNNNNNNVNNHRQYDNYNHNHNRNYKPHPHRLAWKKEWSPRLNIFEGEKLGHRYRVIQKLGEGTSAKVILCVDELTNEEVVLKIQRESDMNYIVQELDVLQAITNAHPKTNDNNNNNNEHFPIIRLLDWFTFKAGQREEESGSERDSTKDGYVCLVFEKGDISLWNYMEKRGFRPFEITEVRRLAKQMLEAIHCIHTLKITHCDIKPENFVVRYPHNPTQPINISLIDFGLASFPHSPNRPLVIGTRQYSGLEVVLQTGYNNSLDIWGLACLFVEMLTGSVLFKCSGDAEQLALFEKSLGTVPSHLIPLNQRRDFFDRYGFVRPLSGCESHISKNIENQKTLRQIVFSASGDLEDLDLFYDLVDRMLNYDPSLRPSARDCLNHPFFNDTPFSPTYHYHTNNNNNRHTTTSPISSPSSSDFDSNDNTPRHSVGSDSKPQ